MQAIIKRITHGRRKGQYRFKLIADNGEPIGGSENESYTQKHNCIAILQSAFPNFEIVDLTGEQ